MVLGGPSSPQLHSCVTTIIPIDTRDGLRSMCVARLRVAVGAGIWRANHKTLGAWAERAYPEGHLSDNGHGAAAA